MPLVKALRSATRRVVGYGTMACASPWLNVEQQCSEITPAFRGKQNTTNLHLAGDSGEDIHSIAPNSLGCNV